MADFLNRDQPVRPASEMGFRLREALRRQRWLVRLAQFVRQPGQVFTNRVLRRQHQQAGAPPIPPGRLIFLVQGSDSVEIFLVSGWQSAQLIRDLLTRHGIDLDALERVLDFGCGAGRILRHWHNAGNVNRLQGPQLFGSELNPELARWCQANLPFAHVQCNQLQQALPYPDDFFDLVYAVSVFTHLSQSSQEFWLAELTRLLRPGGHLVFTTHGDYYYPAYLRSQDRERYREGQLVVYGGGASGRLNSEGSNACVAYHPFTYVRDHLAKRLTLIEFVPETAQGTPFQDVYLFQKPES